MSSGTSILKIGKFLQRNPRTIKKHFTNTTLKTRKDKGVRKSISPLDKINLKRDLFKNPNKTSANYFSALGIPLPSIATRCSILNEFAKCKKAFYKPVLKKIAQRKTLYLGQNLS